MRPLAQTVLWLALVGVCQADSPPTQAIPVSDPNWFFTPYNWSINGSASAVTQNYGAYFTIGFTGTQVALGVDVSFLDGSVAAQWPLIRWQIDGNPTQDIRLKQQDVQISLNPSPWLRDAIR